MKKAIRNVHTQSKATDKKGNSSEVYQIVIVKLLEQFEMKGSILTTHSVLNIPLQNKKNKIQVQRKKNDSMEI